MAHTPSITSEDEQGTLACCDISTHSVQVETDDADIYVIPISVKYDLGNTGPEYLEVKIQVEPSKQTKPVNQTPISNNKVAHPGNKCSICNKAFSSRNHLHRHFNLHSRENIYLCDVCPRVCLDKSTLHRHQLRHSGEKSHVCEVCSKKFYTSTSLKRHQTLHDPDLRAHVCLECGKRFPDKSGLFKHVRLHSGVKSHICSVCSKAFYHIGDLNLHMKCHNPDKPFCCDVCGKTFSRQNNMARHKEIHVGNQNYECDVCKVNYQHAGTLTRHILACHPTKKKMMRVVTDPEEEHDIQTELPFTESFDFKPPHNISQKDITANTQLHSNKV